MNTRIEAAMRSLREQGHVVRPYPHMGEEWFEVGDCCVLVTPQEMEEPAEGVYTFDELKELYRKRRLEEQGLL
jgi:hypothetical protein